MIQDTHLLIIPIVGYNRVLMGPTNEDSLSQAYLILYRKRSFASFLV